MIVDDEPKNLTVLETVLDNPAYRLIKAESADQALLALLVEQFALLILDIRMPGVTRHRAGPYDQRAQKDLPYPDHLSHRVL